MIVHPKYLFKYKTVPQRIRTKQEKLEFERIQDIIVNHRIYMPLCKELNDPAESMSVYISPAVPGSGYCEDVGLIHPSVEEIRDRYRILSLTETPTSMTMWANYAGDYTGMCLAFSTDGALEDVQPVVYRARSFRISECDFPYNGDDLQYGPIPEMVEDSLLFKNDQWSYENEWRIVRESSEKFLSFEKGTLYIILGSKMSTSMKKKIIKLCKENDVSCCQSLVRPAMQDVDFYPASVHEKLDNLKWYNHDQLMELWKNHYPEFLLP